MEGAGDLSTGDTMMCVACDRDEARQGLSELEHSLGQGSGNEVQVIYGRACILGKVSEKKRNTNKQVGHDEGQVQSHWLSPHDFSWLQYRVNLVNHQI